MSQLLVGFDSAWTPNNSGAIIAVLYCDDGTLQEISQPRIVNYPEAEETIVKWQAQFPGASTVIMLDQPTIVANAHGQRPVEGIVAPSISIRLGGMQPANSGRIEMFGPKAPMWNFLRRFGGAANPVLRSDPAVYETYPVLTLIALGWTLPHERSAGRLPKYNPQRTKTFALQDWQYVCALASAVFLNKGLSETARWLEEAGRKPAPRKSDQDSLDACLCLLAAIHVAEGKDNLFIGNLETGYIMAPHRQSLFDELAARCRATGRNHAEWVRLFRAGKFIPAKSAAIASSRITKLHGSVNVVPRTAERPPARLPYRGRWTLPAVASQLDRYRQRVTYGAVAKLLGVLPRGVMNGRPKSAEYSWIVAASGPQRGWPTGYALEDIHPDCLRQIRQSSSGIVKDAEHLRRWLEMRAGTGNPYSADTYDAGIVNR